MGVWMRLFHSGNGEFPKSELRARLGTAPVAYGLKNDGRDPKKVQTANGLIYGGS